MARLARTVVVDCEEGVCSTRLGDGGQFRGVLVIPLTPSTTITSNDDRLVQNLGCVAHAGSVDKGAVDFNVTGFPATIRVILVVQHHGRHEVAVTGPTPVASLARVTIVGAGPGGLAAALRLNNLRNVHVYEKGPKEPPGFYKLPIFKTYEARSLMEKQGGVACSPNVMDASGTDYALACVVGGNQNVNGAVYAPGSPGDLARSVGVDERDARAAMEFVHERHQLDNISNTLMMWQCANASDCDRSTFVVGNTKMTRTSIAESITWTWAGNNTYTHGTITLHTNCAADSVLGSKVTFANKCADNIPISSESPVILASGALVDPQLLGENTFEGYNHYYTYTFENTLKGLDGQLHPQNIVYDADKNIETNSGTVHNSGQTVRMNIHMFMKPSFKESHTVGESYTLPRQAADQNMAQAWHFMGTVDHDAMLVGDNVYVGDAAALKLPFNCHTSAPAAAAGVLAADAVVGVLGKTALPETSSGIQSVAPALFVFGTFVLIAGAVAHVNPTTRVLHYYLMPAGTLITIAGVAVAAASGNARNDHRINGYVALALLVWQSALGIYVRDANAKQANIPKTRVVHRLGGCLLLIAIAALGWSGARSTVYKSHAHSEVDAVTAFTATALAIAVCLLVANVHHTVTGSVGNVATIEAQHSLL